MNAHCEVWGLSAVSCAKTAQPIKMQFGMLSRWVHVCDGLQITYGKGNFVKYRDYYPCAAAMWPFVRLL